MIQSMRWLRVISWRLVVVLLCVSTLAAGTPQVQCRCPAMSAQAIRATPEPEESCCCCKAATTHEGPSCCSKPSSEPAPANSDEPGVSDRGCQKAVVVPEAASLVRAGVECDGQMLAASDVLSIEVPRLSTVSTPSRAPTRDLPPADLQILFERFLI